MDGVIPLRFEKPWLMTNWCRVSDPAVGHRCDNSLLARCAVRGLGLGWTSTAVNTEASEADQLTKTTLPKSLSEVGQVALV